MIIILVLAVAFTVDDFTGIGQLLDPAANGLTGIIGLLLGKYLLKKQ